VADRHMTQQKVDRPRHPDKSILRRLSFLQCTPRLGAPMRPVISWRRPRAARRVDHPRTRLEDSAGPKRESVITATDIPRRRVCGSARGRPSQSGRRAKSTGSGPGRSGGCLRATSGGNATGVSREQAESQESERHGCEEKPPERLRQDRLEGAVQSRRLLPLVGQGCIAE
jgi:hypothetical protein